MKTVLVRISDSDYDYLVRHFALPDDRRFGQPIVAVIEMHPNGAEPNEPEDEVA